LSALKPLKVMVSRRAYRAEVAARVMSEAKLNDTMSLSTKVMVRATLGVKPKVPVNPSS